MVNELSPTDYRCDDPERCETCANWEMDGAYEHTLGTGQVITIPESMKCTPYNIRVHKCWRGCKIWASRE